MAGSGRIRSVISRVLVVAVIGAAAAGLFGYFRAAENNPYTDDASIDADVVHVSPTVSGRISRLDVAENQLVKAGEPMFQIDPEPYRLRVELAKADLQAARGTLDTRVRSVASEASNATVSNQQVVQSRTSLELATNTLRRIQPLAEKGYVSAQELDDAKTNKRKAELAYLEAKVRAESAAASVGTTEEAQAMVAARVTSLALAERDLRETLVRAPHTGRVTGLAVKSGEMVSPAQSLFTLVVTEEWFASANFRETDLARIRVGSCAVAWSLIDRRVAISGRVDGIGWGVSDQDRVILPRSVPRVERSVNWVRVDQRFPVRVRLTLPPEDLMRLGASAVVQIRPDDRC